MSSSGLTSSEIFFHVRVITGFGIGMSLSRLLVFVAGFIQHPGKNRISKIHFLWITFLFLQIVFYWMDYIDFQVGPEKYKLYYIKSILDIFCLYFISVVLTPDNVDEYGNFNNYISEKKIFVLFIFFIQELLGSIMDYYLWPTHDDFSYYDDVIFLFLYLIMIFTAIFYKSNKVQAAILMLLIIVSFTVLLD